MPTPDRRATDSVLVVVEREAACPLWLSDWGPMPEAGWSLIEQEEWEPAEAFAERLQTAIEREMTDATRPAVLLVTSGFSDDDATCERFSLSSTILTTLATNGGGRMSLTVGYGHDGRREPALEALAEELSEEFSASPVTVDVRAGRASRMPEPRRAVVRESSRWAGSDHAALAQ